MVTSKSRPGWVLPQRVKTSDGVETECNRGTVANLRVDLRRGTRPGSSSIIPPLWKVGQREGDPLRRARPDSVSLRRSRCGSDEGVIVGVGSKVVASHGVLAFCVARGEGLRRGERVRGKSARGD